MKIGLIVAVETESIFEYYGNIEKLDSPPMFNVYKTRSGKNDIYIIHTGMGEIASASGTQYLITGYGVDVIVNFGVVGGLTPDMKKYKVCLIDNVVHYRYDVTEFMDLSLGQVAEHDSIFLPTDEKLRALATELFPELNHVNCCSGDKFVATAEEKTYIHETFSGDVCDMESAGIVLTCEANGVPCFLIKAVSDGLSDGAKGFYDELKDAGTMALEVTDKIIGSL